MAWSDAARAAASEARRNMHSSLQNLGGVKTKSHPMVRMLRMTAAKTIRANRATAKRLGFKMPTTAHFLAAHAAVKLDSGRIARQVASIKAGTYHSILRGDGRRVKVFVPNK